VNSAVVLVLAFSSGCSLLPKDNPYPSYVISPGVKVAYTFGPGGGLTYGGEISVPIKHGNDLHAIVAIGPTLDLEWSSRGTFVMTAGMEAVSWFVGFDTGIAWVSDRGGDHVGLAISPWASAIWAVAQYTHIYVNGEPGLDQLGVYGKLPLCFACASGGGGGGLFGHHDHHH
jgi:hypothetical protein